MADEIYGGDVYLIINDDKFGNETGVTNNESSDIIETTHKHTPSKRKTYIVGESTGTISANGVYTLSDPTSSIGYYSLLELQKTGEEVDYEIGYFSTGGIIESGKALIQNCNLSANRGEMVQFDITLQKTGDYDVDTYSS
jgi:predicted secreted protein